MDNHAPLDTDDPIQTARDVARRFLPMDPEQIDALAERVRELDLRARAFVREHPTATVASAVAIGFVIGRLLRR
jgi:ElaB/YqjD/DUF883 family membrane-anchored ribosome-binding protein